MQVKGLVIGWMRLLVCMRIYVSPLGSPRKQEVWGRRGAFGGRNTRRRRRRRERGRGLNFKKPLTHAAAGPDHSTDAFVHCLSFSSPSLSFIPCVFGDTRRVQISKSHCLLRLQTGGPVRQPQSYLCPARRLEWNIWSVLFRRINNQMWGGGWGGCEDSDIWGGGLKTAHFTALQSHYKELSHGR